MHARSRRRAQTTQPQSPRRQHGAAPRAVGQGLSQPSVRQMPEAGAGWFWLMRMQHSPASILHWLWAVHGVGHSTQRPPLQHFLSAGQRESLSP